MKNLSTINRNEAIEIDQPELIYLQYDMGRLINLNGAIYVYDMYVTTTFKTKLYRYRILNNR